MILLVILGMLMHSLYSQKRLTIRENLAEDYEIVNLNEMLQEFPNANNQKSTLFIKSWGDIGVNLFKIDDGILKVASKIDRDELCAKQDNYGKDLLFPSHGQQSTNDNQRVYQQSYNDINLNEKPCIIKLDIAHTLSNQKEPNVFSLSIEIEDENDNPPIFPVASITFNINEVSSRVNEATFELPEARDVDAGLNGHLAYWMDDYVENGTSGAKVENPFNLKGPPIQLRLIRQLDWEEIKEYNILLYVKDSGKPERTSSMTIHINVIDENDWTPEFKEESYRSVINESTSEFTTILNLEGVDRDGPKNGQISFLLATPRSFTESQSHKHFGIRSTGPTTAIIYLKKAIDLDREIINTNDILQPKAFGHEYFKSKEFKFRVIVQDNGSVKKLSSEKTVSVTVLDVNDLQPLIKVIFMKTDREENLGSLKENTNRSFIGYVSVEDSDSGDWGRFTCEMDHPGFNLELESLPNLMNFQKNRLDFTQKHNYKLYSVMPFDREETPEITLRIRCSDNQNQIGGAYMKKEDSAVYFHPTKGLQLTGTAVVRIKIEDVNDNPPKFPQKVYEFIIHESNGRETNSMSDIKDVHIGTVKAIDPDTNTNFTYSLMNDQLDSFKIDSKSGILFLTKSIDRESLVESTKSNFYDKKYIHIDSNENVVIRLIVQVSDQLHETTCEAIVIVKDVNDCEPIFDLNEYVIEISENHPLMSLGEQGRIHARDCDSKMFSKIYFQIQYINDDISNDFKNVHFRIDAVTGQLYLIKPLDREKQSQYRFYILANDVGGNGFNMEQDNFSNSAKTLITVNVLDENDNAPVILNPTRQSNIAVKSNTPAGYKIFTVVASDPDHMENSTIIYNIKQIGLNVDNNYTLNHNKSHETSELFAIDEVSGAVFLTKQMPDIIRDYYLLVTVHDSGHVISKNTSQTVIVKVVDELFTGDKMPNNFEMVERKNLKEKIQYFMSDHTVVFLLASIFIILLLTTIALLLLIRKRRQIEMRNTIPIHSYKNHPNGVLKKQNYITASTDVTGNSTMLSDKSSKTIYRISRIQPLLANDVFQVNSSHQSPHNLPLRSTFDEYPEINYAMNTFRKQKSLSPDDKTITYEGSGDAINQDYHAYLTMHHKQPLDYQLIKINQNGEYQSLKNNIIDNNLLKSNELLTDPMKASHATAMIQQMNSNQNEDINSGGSFV